MNNNEIVNKKEGTLVSQSIMTLLSILIFTIGVALVTSTLLLLFTKIIGLNTEITVQELLENDVLIPDYFSNVVSYSICRILLSGISIPIVFFLAIKDRFKGSYMNLIDLKRFKMILVIIVILYTLVFGAFYYKYYTTAVEKFAKNNNIIQENKADEKGYYNEGVKKVDILPLTTVVVFAIAGSIGVYVAVVTAESTNRKYLNSLMEMQAYQYQYAQQQPVVNNPNTRGSNILR